MSKGAILLVIGDAAEVLDTFYPLFRLQEEGYEVRVAGPKKRVCHLSSTTGTRTGTSPSNRPATSSPPT